MTSEEFRNALTKLEYNQVGIARLFGVTDRTGRRWASGEVPVPLAVAAIINRWLREGLTSDIRARIIVARLDGELGPEDEQEFLWVKPRGEDQKWQIARKDKHLNRYYLTGMTLAFTMAELEIGPRVHLDVPDDIANEIAVLGQK